MWPLDESSSTYAKWITGILGGLAIAFKLLLRGRKDLREDGAGAATSEAFGRIIDGQAAEITRLVAALGERDKRIDAEIAVRHRMETEAADLRRRADHAQARAEQAFARARAGEEAALILKAQIAALEMQVEQLERRRDGGG